MTEKTNSALSPDRFGVKLADKKPGERRADGASLPLSPEAAAIADTATRE